ncbi:MAG: nitroreductase/quinone reductase family protein [Chloroflexota bacterium]|nr:nitroreductase/quinone reductase family protein [Chloroflexota bacterium]
MAEMAIGEELAGWGKVALLETRGRASGRPVRAAVGFVEEPDGSLLVAAASETTGWARNLRADPRCTVTIAARSGRYEATEVDDDVRARTVTALILRYGTPAERLGHGPAFRLRPLE